MSIVSAVGLKVQIERRLHQRPCVFLPRTPENLVRRPLLNDPAVPKHDHPMRESAHYPPFGRLASIVVSDPDKHDTQSFARLLVVRRKSKGGGGRRKWL